MGAREKLNSASLYGILVIAGLAGLLTRSWGVFFLLAAALTMGAILGGDIRLVPQPRRPRRRRR
jgi:hypothetical protein